MAEKLDSIREITPDQAMFPPRDHPLTQRERYRASAEKRFQYMFRDGHLQIQVHQ
jgi:hypothetical protein